MSALLIQFERQHPIAFGIVGALILAAVLCAAAH
jgi:hypothetical protein